MLYLKLFRQFSWFAVGFHNITDPRGDFVISGYHWAIFTPLPQTRLQHGLRAESHIFDDSYTVVKMSLVQAFAHRLPYLTLNPV